MEKLDRDLQEICSMLEYQPGSIFRIASQYYSNWGIDITPENTEWLLNRSRTSYLEEWERGTRASNEAIELAVQDAGLTNGNLKLNTTLAQSVADILPQIVLARKNAVVCDVGAGAGDTTIAVLDELERRDEGETARATHFYLVEPSIQRLAVAEKNIGNHPYGKSIGLTLVKSDDYNHLPMVRDSLFDAVYSNAVFHHMSFTTHFKNLHRKIVDDGALIIGDWFTTVWKHPGFIVPIFKGLGMDTERIEAFKSRFGIRDDDVKRLEEKLDPDQKEANYEMVRFEQMIMRRFRDIPSESRLFFLEAHESLGDRIHKLERCRFQTDIDEMKKHTNFARLPRSVRKSYPSRKVAGELGEFTTVISARKIKS